MWIEAIALLLAAPPAVWYVTDRLLKARCRQPALPEDGVPSETEASVRRRTPFLGTVLPASITSLVVTSVVMLAPAIGQMLIHQKVCTEQVSVTPHLIPSGLVDAGLPLWPVVAANVLVVAAAVDATCRIIPNQLILPGLLSGLLLAFQERALMSALLGGAVGFLLLFVPHQMRRGALGFGDVKLAAFIGVATRVENVVLALFAGGIIGGLYGIGLLLTRRADLKDSVPYGPCLALGGIIGLWCTAAGIRV